MSDMSSIAGLTLFDWPYRGFRCHIDWRPERASWTPNLWRWSVAQVNAENAVVTCAGDVVSTCDDAYRACLAFIEAKQHD